MELNDIGINELCDKLKTTANKITKNLFGLRRNFRTEGLSTGVEILCQNRREVGMNMLKSPADASTREIYKTLNKKVNYEVVAHKSKLLGQGIKQLEDGYVKVIALIHLKQLENLKTNPKNQIWKERFEKHLNTEILHEAAGLDKIIVGMSDEPIEPNITKNEIRKATKSLKNPKIIWVR